MKVRQPIPESRCKCGRFNKGYHHKTTEAGIGCGLVNDIKEEAEHDHYYCGYGIGGCGRSHIIFTSDKRRIDSHA